MIKCLNKQEEVTHDKKAKSLRVDRNNLYRDLILINKTL